jgi:NAD(P)-dependent dehydrogenase (short-subunit alcohol dehydrogenase family)
MDLKLQDKLAFVTGSTAGIGFAIAKALAAEGARVIINGRSEQRVAAAMASLRASHPSAKLEPLVSDLSQASAAAQSATRFPGVDILVNNLGVYVPKPFEQISDADWLAIIETNFMSGVRLSRHYLPRMKAAGWGRILFISSESAVNIPVEMIHYGVTKTMQVALARGLAETTAGTAVTVNSILAGPTRSEGVEDFIGNIATTRGITPQQVEKEFFQTVPVHYCNASPRRMKLPRWWRSSQAPFHRRPTGPPCAWKAASCAPFFRAAQRLLRRTGAILLSHSPSANEPISKETPLTGELDAGNPPVRFGGRGRVQSPAPTPIVGSMNWPWLALLSVKSSVTIGPPPRTFPP